MIRLGLLPQSRRRLSESRNCLALGCRLTALGFDKAQSPKPKPSVIHYSPMVDVETGRFTVGVFQDVAWAEKGLDALKQAGFVTEALTVLAKEGADVSALFAGRSAWPPIASSCPRSVRCSRAVHWSKRYRARAAIS